MARESAVSMTQCRSATRHRVWSLRTTLDHNHILAHNMIGICSRNLKVNSEQVQQEDGSSEQRPRPWPWPWTCQDRYLVHNQCRSEYNTRTVSQRIATYSRYLSGHRSCAQDCRLALLNCFIVESHVESVFISIKDIKYSCLFFPTRDIGESLSPLYRGLRSILCV